MEHDDKIAAGAIVVLGGTGMAVVFGLAGVPVVLAIVFGYLVVALIVAGVSWALWYRK